MLRVVVIGKGFSKPGQMTETDNIGYTDILWFITKELTFNYYFYFKFRKNNDWNIKKL